MILWMPETLLNKSAVADYADALLPEYREIIAKIPREAGFGGIWESELFLFYAAVKPFAPKQILNPVARAARARSFSRAVFPNRESSASNTIENPRTLPLPKRN